MKRNPRLTVIGFIVLIGHLWFTFYNFKDAWSPSPPKKSIIVHTYSPPKPKPKPKPSPPQITAVKQKKVLPQNKKPAPAKQAKPNKNTLKNLEETLAKIEAMQDKTKNNIKLSVPESIPKLNIDRPISIESESKTSDYLSLVVQHLKTQLELPETGKVRLQLTILQSGQIKSMKILASESEKNQHYLEIHLKTMQFPPFTDDWESTYEQTVIITFCNE